ncbi:unnamed protein product [Trichobilharzia regenti]|nr:unnamed protein product [Trichobilharzia regenti]
MFTRYHYQSKVIKNLRICEEEPKSSTAVNKEFANDEVDQTNGGKVDISDSGHDSALLSMVDYDEMSGVPTTAELNKGSVQLQREVDLKAGAVAEGMDTCGNVSVIDQRVAHLLIDIEAEKELIIKDSSGGYLIVRQPSTSRAPTAFLKRRNTLLSLVRISKV